MQKTALSVLSVLLALLIIPCLSSAAEKPKLVLMPIKTTGVETSYNAPMESAVVKGLSERYRVYAGDQVRKKAREIFDKVGRETKVGHQCDETRCMQDIAIEFQTELIAIASVIKNKDGYLLSLNIRNIMDDTAIASESISCENCNEFQVVEKLKTISFAGSVASSPSFVTSSPSGSTGSAGPGGIEDISPTSTSSQGTGPAGIYITTEPKGAEVYLGDIMAGKADPAFQKLNMTAGQRVQITLRLPEYNPTTFEALLKSGITKYEGIKLKPAFGFLTVNGKPDGAVVEIGGSQIGELPLKKLKLKSGKHLLTVHKDLYETISDRIIEIKDGEETIEAVTLNEAFGTLNVSSNPTDAEVLVDGKEVGKTPLQGYRMSPGKYELTVRKSGYTEKKYTATVTKGKELTITSDKATLRERLFSAQIFSDPPEQGARVYVDGIDKGEAPLTVENLTEGTHKVEVKTKEKSGLIDVTGKDGESKMVEVKLATVQPKAVSPTIKLSNSSYTDNGNGTVTASKTGLMWQKKDDNKKRKWSDAISYCDGLTLAGYSDWRLPEIDELVTLVDKSKGSPTIDTTFFPDTISSGYWSSTTYAVSTSYAWIVVFYYGYSDTFNKTNSNYVRCVRGGQ